MSNEEEIHATSESLHAYAAGDIGSAERSDIDAHLETCAGCSRELAAVRALLAPSDDGLTNGERLDLRAGIRARLEPKKRTETVRTVVPAPATPRWAAYLGAAALVLVVAVGALWAINFGGGSSNDSGGEVSAESAGDQAGGSEVSPVYLADLEGVTESFEPADDGAEADAASEESSPERQFALNSFTKADLVSLATEGPLFRSYLEAYTSPVEEGLGAFFLETLAAQAPTEETGDMIVDCGTEVLESRLDGILPVMATRGIFQKTDSLAIGFALAPARGAPLSQYSYLVWRTGSCDFPVTSFLGETES